MSNAAVFILPKDFTRTQGMTEVEIEETFEILNLNQLVLSKVELDSYNLQMGLTTQKKYNSNVSY